MSINLNVTGNTQPLESAVQAAVNRIRRTPIKITVDDKGATQPLGNMKRGADEFSKSMEAANARIIAFGASMAIINGVADAFKAVVKNVVEVEKAMADINVVMGLSAQKLDQFSDGLFKVAKETAASFDVASAAAVEYARQGLKVEETLKRTKDALILTRLTGMDSANAVKALTAAMNTYGDQIKDTTQLVSKFAAVDVQFAVSAEDFADAISRTGQAAKSAGVDIDELVGLVTAAQQQTARGGKVIGNSFKTIFTRIGRTDTLNQLENLGIAVRDIEGNTLGAKRILTDLANTFDTLTESQKAQIAQTVGGVFQINVLKAVLSDAAKQNGILANATQISASATDEAIQKNEQLRNTMAAMASETGLALKEVSAQIGEIMLAPGMEKILNLVKSTTEGIGNLLGSGEGSGSSFAKGFLKGLGNVITGPGLVVMVAVFTKLLVKAVQYANTSLKSLIGVTSEAQKQKAIQTSLVNLFGQNAALSKEMLRTDISRTEKEKIILGLLKAQVAEASTLNAVSRQAASMLYRKGYGANLSPRRADGHIPNFANPERAQAARGGYAAGSIRSMNMPGEGSVIYNSAETVKNFAGFKQPAIMPPKSSKAGQSYQQAFGNIHGFDPYAAGGYIPNFIKPSVKLGNRPDITTPEQAKAAGYSGAAISARFGKGAAKKTSTKSGASIYNLNTLFPQTSKLGVLLGFGPESATSNQNYRQGYSTLSSLAQQKLQKKTGKTHKDLQKSWVNVSLPTKALYEISNKDVDSFEGLLGKSTLEKNLYSHVSRGFDKFSHSIGKRIFGKNVGRAGVNVLKTHMDGGTFGNLIESAIRGSLDNKPADDKGAAFDFIGENAKNLSKFMGVSGLTAIELKYATAAAAGKKGKLPLKVLNHIAANGFIPNFANPLSDAISREKAAGVPVSQIRVGSHSALMNKGNPLGLGVTNTKDEPNGLRDVFGANGFVPNYAFMDQYRAGRGFDRSEEEFNRLITDVRDQRKNLKNRTATVKRLQKEEAQGVNVSRELRSARKNLIYTEKRLSAAQQKLASARGAGLGGVMGRAAGRMSGMGTMATIGLPMVGGMMQQYAGGMGAAGGNQNIYAAGGALTGAATGAMMGGMIGSVIPVIGTAIGASIGGLAGAFMGWKSATEENTKALSELAKAAAIKDATAQTSILGQALSAVPLSSLIEYSQDLTRLVQGINPDNIRNEDTQRQVDFLKNMLTNPSVDQDQKVQITDDQAKALGLFSGSTTATIAEIAKGSSNIMKKIQEAENDNKGRTDENEIKSNNDRAKTLREMLDKLLRDTSGRLAVSAQNAKKERKAVIRRLNLVNAATKIQARINKELSAEKISIARSVSAYSWVDKFESFGNEIVKNQAKFSKEMESLANDFDLDKFKLAQQQSIAALDKLGKAGATVEVAIKDFISDPKKMANIPGISDDTKNVIERMRSGNADYTEVMSGLSFDQILQMLNLIGEKNTDIKNIGEEIVENYDKELQSLKNTFNEKSELLKIENKMQSESARRLEIEKSITREISAQNDFARNQSEISELSFKLAKLKSQNENRFSTSQSRIISDINIARKQSSAIQEKDSASVARGAADKIRDMYKDFGVAAPQQLLDARASGKISMVREQMSGASLSGLMSAPVLRGALQKVNNEMKNLSDENSPTYQSVTSKLERLEELEQTERTASYTSGGPERRAEIKSIRSELLKHNQKVEKITARAVKLNELINMSEKERAKTIEEIVTNIEVDLQGQEKILNLKKKINDEELETLKNRLPGTFSEGIKKGFSTVRDQTDAIDFQLGEQLPLKLRDGLAEAMQAGINGAEDMGDVLRNIAIDFLGAIQKAMLQKTAGNVLTAMGFSQGGNVRNYSRGGGVPAMVTNGEYVMGRDAVKKYGGGFMHRLNAGGKLPGYSNGGRPGSALAANFGGGEGYATGRRYQSQPMSGFFYSGQAGNVGLQEDAQYTRGLIEARRRKEQEKKAKKRALMQTILGTAISFGLAYGSERMVNNVGLESTWQGTTRYAPGALPEGQAYVYHGGPIRKYADGGHIVGKSGIDQIPAMLSEGEYVIRASSARQLGKPMLDRINAGKFNDGGAVTPLMENSETGTSSGNTNNINITVNMQKGGGKSEQQDSSGSGGTNPKDASEDAKKSNELAEKVRDQVISVIMDEQRPGGLLSD